MSDIPIVDAAIAKQVNATDSVSEIFFLSAHSQEIQQYDPYIKGVEQCVLA